MTLLLFSKSSVTDWTSTNWPQQSGSSLIIQAGSNDDAKDDGGFGELGTDCSSGCALGATPDPVFCFISRAKAAAKPEALVPLIEGRVEIDELWLEDWVDAQVFKDSFDSVFLGS